MKVHKIYFEWDGRTYSVPFEAYDDAQYVRLPSGILLRVMAWQESLPPVPTFIIVKAMVDPVNGVFDAAEDYSNHQMTVHLKCFPI